MYYDKRIRYLSYYESDIKLQNAGYVKFQVRDCLCQMVIHVKGPRFMGNGESAVYLLSRKQEESDEDSFYTGARDSGLQKHLLGNLNIRGGQGHCAVRMNAENMADSGLRYDEICGIRIELHEYQYLESLWNMVNYMPERQQAQNGGSRAAGFQLRKEQGDIQQREHNGPEDRPQMAVTGEDMAENASDDEDSIQKLLEREIRKEEGEAVLKTEEAEIVEAAEAVKAGRPEENEITEHTESEEEELRTGPLERELQPDKWEQLRATYSIVHPIREEEEYLKITPRDFVIFTEKYQELVHNSFLMHGYYNYKHLILGKKERDGKAVYYLGVPGTFHDREKSVAVMFGFEAFDGKREPAEKGDFGYYLRRVEI